MKDVNYFAEEHTIAIPISLNRGWVDVSALASMVGLIEDRLWHVGKPLLWCYTGFDNGEHNEQPSTSSIFNCIVRPVIYSKMRRQIGKSVS